MRLRAVLCAAVLVSVAGCGSTQRTGQVSAPSTAASSPAASVAPTGDEQAIPRTRISLPVPEGLRVEPSLPGIGRSNSRTSIVVTEQPVNGKPVREVLDEVAAGMTGEQAKRQGMEWEKPVETTIAGFPAFLTSGTQTVSMGTFRKVNGILAAEGVLVVITGTLEPGDPLTVDDFKKVIIGARWSAEAAPGSIGFDLTPAEGYQRKESTAALSFTRGGQGGPKLVAAPSMGQGRLPEDKRAYAVDRFGKTPSAPSADTVTEVTIAALSGFEMVGRDNKGRTAYGVMTFTDTGYIFVAGDFDPAKHGDQLPAFKQMARSLVLK
ncbi:hypothetical protein LCL61_37165 [Amycolatopsis coloradensis]|uniref:Uncharacterized protein n=1 Tax=Amycolatopsis coloradensis TaxID=76021 RepID=A0ACD5BPA1_9PSEU